MDVFFRGVLRLAGKYVRKNSATRLVDFVDRKQFKANAEVLGELASIVNASLRRVRSWHADADDVFGADCFGSDGGRESGVDAAAQSDDHALEAALAHVIARA